MKDTTPKDPHWVYYQEVRFNPPEFFSGVCKGEGIVVDKYSNNDGHVVYTVVNRIINDNSDCFNARNSFDIEFKRD